MRRWDCRVKLVRCWQIDWSRVWILRRTGMCAKSGQRKHCGAGMMCDLDGCLRWQARKVWSEFGERWFNEISVSSRGTDGI